MLWTRQLPPFLLLAAIALASIGLSPCEHGVAVVSGTIRDYTGNPLAKATVVCHGLEWSSDCRMGRGVFRQTSTDSAGRYELTVPAGAYPLQVRHPRLPRPEFITSDTLHEGTHHLDYKFQAWHVHGIVLGPDSLPLAKGHVMYYHPQPGMCGTGLPDVAFKNGTFDLLIQSDPDYVFWVGTGPPLDFVAPALAPHIPIYRDTTITFSFVGHEVHGIIRGYSGSPLADADIYAQGGWSSSRAHTDTSGRFRMILQSDQYRILLGASRLECQQDLLIGTADIHQATQIDFDADLVRWDGQVRIAGSHETLDSIHVHVAEGSARANAYTDRHGRFHVFLRRGSTVGIDAADMKTYDHPSQGGEDGRAYIERIEREFGRVQHLTIDHVPVGNDSSLVLEMEQVRK